MLVTEQPSALPWIQYSTGEAAGSASTVTLTSLRVHAPLRGRGADASTEA